MNGHFLQSHEWEEFQRSLGREVFRVDGILVTKLPLAFGKTYFYCGGCVKFNFKQLGLGDLAKRGNAVFFKFEPMLALRLVRQSLGVGGSLDEGGTEDKALAQEFIKAGFTKSKKEVQPQRTIILDLTQSLDTLLSAMHEKTRYNIRVATKKDLRFTVCDAREGTVGEFWELLQKTAARDKFSSHPKEYYKKLLEMPCVKLFAIEYKGKIIAASIALFYGKRVTYLHGASDYDHRNLMAPYLLHWETIKYAKERGFKEYDFWGIDEEKWPGLTRFKRGFGEREVEYIGSYDYVFQPMWYALYEARNFIKGFPRKLGS